MKLKIVAEVTESEYGRIAEKIFYDPCEAILCSEIECSQCPLSESAKSLRAAQENFMHQLLCTKEKK